MQIPVGRTDVPVAVIGMACRLPGADNLEQFWQLLVSGGSAVVELPPDRLDQELYYDPRRGQRGKSYAKLGAIVSSRKFDRGQCAMPAQLERSVDNAHLLMCQTAATACRHAGLDPFQLPLRNTGVFIGHAQGSDLAGEYTMGTCIEEAAQFLREVPGFLELAPAAQEAILRDLITTVRAQMPQRSADSPDVAINMVAGTISKAFGLSGPFMAVNSACASSLQATMYGVRALQLGRIDMAIVGGASDCKSDSMVLFSHAQSMSETGSRPFDSGADGLICSEGYVSLVLKTLDRALADGDPIQAVIRGLGASCDGKGKSLWAPRKEGQVKAMARAYRNGLDMATLQYIEAHATSTNLGDATELNALGEILSEKFPAGKKIPITSVKANIGHALESAGLSSVIKTILCLQHRTFVPAINIQTLNPKINWESAPFYIQRELAAWPEQQGGLPRRAAVNAFGIGGLNVHIVLDEFTEAHRQMAAATRQAPKNEDAVAVIGMGCILPGAAHVAMFKELLASGRDPKSHAPVERMPAALVHEPGPFKPYRTPSTLGGYITDFSYDWRRHKVPPKQVAEADPLQFMLLDAAEQALVDAGYDKKAFDRERVGVIVGTEFGSDFSIQLEMGLKLPHVQKQLRQLLAARGVGAAQAAQIAEQYGDAVLKHWPALVDESGSFSTSTLASRITKTMNLMGGATSLDAGAASGAAAVGQSIDALLSGDCDMMICAAGQRCLSLAAFEGMASVGVLATADAPLGPFDASAQGVVPGEGVGVVLLKRLSDARRDGDRIHAIIRGVGAAHSHSGEESQRVAVERALEIANVVAADVAVIEIDGSGLREEDQEQVRALLTVYGREPRAEPLLLGCVTGQIGHTVGASAMAGLIKASLQVESGEMPATFGVSTPLAILQENAGLIRTSQAREAVRHTTHDGRRMAGVMSYGKGLAYHIVLERGEKVPVAVSAVAPAAAKKPISAAQAPVTEVVLSTANPVNQWRILRLGAATPTELAAKVQATLADCAGAFAAAPSISFAPEHRVRLAVVAGSAEMLSQRLQTAAKQMGNPAALPVLEQQGCFYRQVGADRPRVAFVFPGQGSHYAGMLRELVREVPAAAAKMQEIDAVMTRRGLQTFAQMAWDNPQQLGADVWVTQVVMLLSDMIVHAAVTDLGVRPDLLTGHSYGEYAALTAAGAWDLDSVITAARARYDGIEATPTARGTMMATTAPAELIEQLAATLADRAYPANFNAPDQTVVGGRPETLQTLAGLLESRGHKSQLLPVPCPFHTPLMAGAGAILRKTLDTLRINPPRVPFASTVTNRFVAEPDDIRTNLAAQLTTAVRWVDLINRLAAERETVFVEIGPQQALTRLNRRILDGRNVAGIIACDNPKRPGVEQLFHVRALLECTGAIDTPTPILQSMPAQASVATVARGAIAHVDATVRRRDKMRDTAKKDAPAGANGHGVAGATAHPGENGANGSSSVGHLPLPSTPNTNGNGNGHGSASHGESVAAGVAARKPAATAHPAVPTAVVPPVAVPKAAPPAAPPVAPVPVAPVAAVAPQVVPQPAAAAPVAVPSAELEKFLINFVVEQTGYPPEVVELDADLEADLGIDSIKKAQLFGELAEYFDVQPTEGMTLDDFPTLRHVLNFLAAAPMKGAGADVVAATAPVVAPVAQVVAPPAAVPPVEAVAPQPVPQPAAAAPAAVPSAELEKFLINFVVEQTGYPPEVVELDADLEADLGIDSIKKAQLFGELAEYFDVQPTEGMTLDDFPTLRHVLNFLAAAPMKGAGADVVATAAPVVAPVTPTVAPAVATPSAAPVAAFTPQPVSQPAVPAAAPAGVPSAELEKFLINFVVEQTGYPPEVIELDADLEADLGIDSIKKAQLFGELAEYF
ncbi:MAG TPA: beta-ketoacyl synthase N-terminal-like domain-containing protein, partial [Pirellulales bacterium]